MEKKIAFLGCGEFPMPGAINVDIRELPGVDVVSDVRKLPFKDGELDGISSRNLIEHFGRHEVGPMVKEWVRCLASDGFLQTETVDMGRTMDKWRDIPQEELIDCLYGAETYDENYHKMLMTEDILVKLYHDAGLKVIDVKLGEFRDIPRMVVIGIKQ